ncbi:hypothetical protein FSZ17_18785 [Cytobacillus dafuensis]|uniref:Uncharacterized protein n=2 Tax=Cytobacillus dafuensis TaxID=1742359 RepID=A0A5B8ZB42_CYTDA|nr:hypothetical protein FSZ17_18785 [Cytobacillus dafuensis]
MGSFLSNLKADVGGLAFAIIGFTGTFVALAMNHSLIQQKWWRVFFLTFSWTLCVILLVVIPDTRVLQNFVYALMFYFELFDWPVLQQLLCIVGGILWGATALFYQRRSAGACVDCGRIEGDTNKTKLTKWGKWSTLIAVIMALPYGIVRLAWAAGLPLGTPEIDMTLTGRLVEAFLGGLPIMGAILTLGLIQKWGEVFPRWCLIIAGKRVPIWFAVIPAAIASILLTIAGLKVSPVIIMGILDGSINSANWGELLPALSWFFWGVSLGAATLSYYLRRRSQCRYCGIGG